MNEAEARKILGLKADDNPRAFLKKFEKKRQLKQSWIDKATNKKKKARLLEQLEEYETAMSLLMEMPEKKPSRTPLIFALVVIIAFAAAICWGNQWCEKQWQARIQKQQNISEWELKGRTAVIAGKWDEAKQAYQKIETLDPGSMIASSGRQDIKHAQERELQKKIAHILSKSQACLQAGQWDEAEKFAHEIIQLDPDNASANAKLKAIAEGRRIEELNQQIFYTLGECQAALEAGRWGEAEKLARKVVQLDPGNKDVTKKLKAVAEGRRKEEIQMRVLAVSKELEQNNLTNARKSLALLRSSDPENARISEFKKLITDKENQIKRREEQALKHFAAAKKLDTGVYSAEAINLLDEARRLYPKHAEIRALHQKMSAYTQVLNVPEDFPTIAQALAAARPNDLIRIAKGIYQEAIVINKPLRIEGTEEDGTIIELSAKENSLLTIQAQAPGTHVTNLVFKHIGFNHDKDRFSGITVVAKNTSLRGCKVSHAAGHGIAVIDGASAEIIGCKINACGWDGISIYGEKSFAHIKDSRCENNLQHGVSFWRGGSGRLVNSWFVKSGFCGVVAMSLGAEVSIASCTASNNREAGILVSNGVMANIAFSLSEKNRLSGIVARGKGTRVSMNNNLTQNNQEAGILIHQEVLVKQFKNNQSKGNIGQQIWRDAKLGNRSHE